MTKAEQHEAIRERARAALRDLYHNATPNYPRLDDAAARQFESWFQGAAEFEIEYLQDGGAYGRDYRATLAAPCNAGKFKSERARAYYVAKGMRAREMERADCGTWTGWKALESAARYWQGKALPASADRPVRNNAQWERITEYGELYTWGRGGRTLAPRSLIREGGGGSFNIRKDYADDLSIAAVMDLIRVLESFNAYVAAWCDGVPEMWRERCAEMEAEARQEKKRAAAARKEERRRAALVRCFC